MSVLDIILVIVILGIVAWEGIRGFGKACFDGLALYASLWITSTVYTPLASCVHFTAGHAANQGIVFGVCFTALAFLAIICSHYTYAHVQLDMGMFNNLMGVAAGIAVAVILSHGMVRTIDISAGSPTPSAVAKSTLGEEALNFDSYHSVMTSLFSATAPRRSASAN